MRVHVHGNCQATAVATYLRAACPDWVVTAHEVMEIALDDPAMVAGFQADVAAADLVLSQPIGRGYRGSNVLTLDGIRDTARPGVPVFIFPSMFFRGQLPSIGYLPERFPGYLLDYHDYQVAALTLRGLPTRVIQNLMLADDLYDRAFVFAQVEASLTELRRREDDAGVTVRVSDLIADAVDGRVIMHSVNHPQPFLFKALVDRILRLVGETRRVPASAADPLPMPHIPPLPAVERHLGLGGDDREFCYVTPSETLSRADFMVGAAGYYRAVPHARLAALLWRRPEAIVLLRDFAATHAPFAATDADLLEGFVEVTHAFLNRRAPVAVEVLEDLAVVRSSGPAALLQEMLESDEFQLGRAAFASSLPGAVPADAVGIPLGYPASDHQLRSLTGTRVGAEIVLADAPAGPGLFGPYVALGPGEFRARLRFRSGRALAGTGVLDVAANHGRTLFGTVAFDAAALDAGTPGVEVAFRLDQRWPDVEVRLTNDAGFTGHVTGVEISEVTRAHASGRPT